MNKVWSEMTHAERIDHVAGWAVAMMRARGSVSCTHEDGDYIAIATREGVTVSYRGDVVYTGGAA